MQTTAIEISTILQIPVETLADIHSEILSVSIDSRTIIHPKTTLFVSLKGDKTSGNLFIPELIRKGVRNFILNIDTDKAFSEIQDVNYFYTSNPLSALQKIVEYKRSFFHIPIVGITGSNGKTIVKEWLSQLLSITNRVVKNPKSYNSQIGVPLSLWALKETDEFGIFEAGISKPDEMQNLERMIQPTIGILTHLGDAHQSHFKSYDEKLAEKLKLFVNSKQLIVNNSILNQYNHIFEKFKLAHPNIELITWGNNPTSDFYIVEDVQSHSLKITVHKQSYSIPISHWEPTFIENCIQCLVALYTLRGDIEAYIPYIQDLSPIEMRLEILEGTNDSILINDTYNADRDSLSIAISYLKTEFAGHKKALILTELGEQENSIEDILENVSLEYLILIGDSFTHRERHFPHIQNQYVYRSTEDFIKQFPHSVLSHHIILFKGARRFGLEKVVQRYRKKTHSTYLKVHLNALRNNLEMFREFLHPTTKIMLMLKAQGYGLGSAHVAKALEQQRVDYYAVAYTDEGIELRLAGIQKPIMVMNPEVDNLTKLIEQRLEPEIYSISILKEFIQKIEESFFYLNEPLWIHLKLETGMHRLGIPEEEVDEAIDILLQSKYIQVRGILSHLAGSDEERLDDYTKEQCQKFIHLSSYIENKLGYSTLKHILNTEGIVRHPDFQFDMVRLGIGLFGLDSSNTIQSRLQNTISLVSKISQIKHLSSGQSVGYGRKGIVLRDSKIATINIGYADGYFRSFGNGRANAFIHGHYAPTIGNICMDMTMLDITDIDYVEVGDEVELIGTHVSVQNMAEIGDTIPYEILTSISNRVQRVYWED